MERKITVTISEYKAVALDMALAGKETSIQQELEKTLAKLFDRHVSQGARELAEKLEAMQGGRSQPPPEQG